jgi:HK97 family phage major capsid protein
VSIEGEGSTLNQSKLKVESNVLRLNKAQILVPVSDELLEDAVGLSVYLEREVGDRLSFRVDDWLINGDGVEKPMGLLNAGARITQTKEGAQAAATIVAANVSKMMGRLPASAIESAIWLAHPETLPQLQGLGFPTYAPAGISGGPDPTLLGRPVYYREACAPLGTPGDLILFVPSGYFAAVRTYAGAANDIRSDVSMHVWFDYDVSALRFSMRVAGTPWLAAPFVRYKTSTTVSSVVVLEAR